MDLIKSNRYSFKKDIKVLASIGIIIVTLNLIEFLLLKNIVEKNIYLNIGDLISIWTVQISLSTLVVTLISLVMFKLDYCIYGLRIIDILKSDNIGKPYYLWIELIMLISISNIIAILMGNKLIFICNLLCNLLLIGIFIRKNYIIIFFDDYYKEKVKRYIYNTITNVPSEKERYNLVCSYGEKIKENIVISENRKEEKYFFEVIEFFYDILTELLKKSELEKIYLKDEGWREVEDIKKIKKLKAEKIMIDIIIFLIEHGYSEDILIFLSKKVGIIYPYVNKKTYRDYDSENKLWQLKNLYSFNKNNLLECIAENVDLNFIKGVISFANKLELKYSQFKYRDYIGIILDRTILTEKCDVKKIYSVFYHIYLPEITDEYFEEIRYLYIIIYKAIYSRKKYILNNLLEFIEEIFKNIYEFKYEIIDQYEPKYYTNRFIIKDFYNWESKYNQYLDECNIENFFNCSLMKNFLNYVFIIQKDKNMIYSILLNSEIFCEKIGDIKLRNDEEINIFIKNIHLSIIEQISVVEYSIRDNIKKGRAIYLFVVCLFNLDSFKKIIDNIDNEIIDDVLFFLKYCEEEILAIINFYKKINLLDKLDLNKNFTLVKNYIELKKKNIIKTRFEYDKELIKEIEVNVKKVISYDISNFKILGTILGQYSLMKIIFINNKYNEEILRKIIRKDSQKNLIIKGFYSKSKRYTQIYMKERYSYKKFNIIYLEIVCLDVDKK